MQRSKDIKQEIRTYLPLDGAIFLALRADLERKGQLVRVLLRITAEPEPESANERFNALPPYAFVQARIITADSCAASLKACDPDDFPNLYFLFKIAATLPVTSCECERSISTMRRLNNYVRCTMGASRLSSLAIMHIRYEQSRAGELGA